MRKVLLAAVVAALAVVGYSVLAAANAGEAGSSWEFAMKPNKVNKPAKSHTDIKPSKVEDQGTADRSDDVYTSTEKTTVFFPKGSSVDTSALARCKLTASQVGSGQECPGKTKLGDGFANVVVGGAEVGGGKRQGGTDVNATVEAFNTKTKIYLVVQTCGLGTGPSTDKECEPAGPPNVLEGKWSKVTTRPTLVVPTTPSLIAIGTVITRFVLDTDKFTKTVKEDGKEVLHSFTFTPEECTGKWKSAAKADYTDGTSQTIKDTQKCRKP